MISIEGVYPQTLSHTYGAHEYQLIDALWMMDRETWR